MILNKLSVKFQFAYKNTPSFFRWGVLFAIIVFWRGVEDVAPYKCCFPFANELS